MQNASGDRLDELIAYARQKCAEAEESRQSRRQLINGAPQKSNRPLAAGETKLPWGLARPQRRVSKSNIKYDPGAGATSSVQSRGHTNISDGATLSSASRQEEPQTGYAGMYQRQRSLSRDRAPEPVAAPEPVHQRPAHPPRAASATGYSAEPYGNLNLATIADDYAQSHVRAEPHRVQRPAAAPTMEESLQHRQRAPAGHADDGHQPRRSQIPTRQPAHVPSAASTDMVNMSDSAYVHRASESQHTAGSRGRPTDPAPRPSANTASHAAPYAGEEAPTAGGATANMQMEPCRFCSRTFMAERLAKHESICQKQRTQQNRRRSNSKTQLNAAAAEYAERRAKIMRSARRQASVEISVPADVVEEQYDPARYDRADEQENVVVAHGRRQQKPKEAPQSHVEPPQARRAPVQQPKSPEEPAEMQSKLALLKRKTSATGRSRSRPSSQGTPNTGTAVPSRDDTREQLSIAARSDSYKTTALQSRTAPPRRLPSRESEQRSRPAAHAEDHSTAAAARGNEEMAIPAAAGGFGGFGDSSAQASGGAAFPPADDANVSLAECPTCGRSFREDRLAKHAKICQKASQKKRKQFNATAARLGDNPEAMKLMKQPGSVAKAISQTKTTQPAPQAARPSARPGLHARKDTTQTRAPPPSGAAAKPKKVSKWRRQSEELQAAMRAARGAAPQKMSSGFNPSYEPSQESYDDRVPCPHCGRKFIEEALSRHQPICVRVFGSKKKAGAAGKTTTTATRGRVARGPSASRWSNVPSRVNTYR